MGRRALITTASLLALSWAATASTVWASPIAGATYNGRAADGATVTFTISADGTLVTSYRITEVKTPTCQFYAEGDNGVWGGAAIVSNTFEYRYYDAILFGGAFPGAQTASGSFRLYNHATNATQACDTGMVSWTATTTAAPPQPGAGGSGGSGGRARAHAFPTRLVLRKLSRKMLGGRVKSPSGLCRAGRTVILWRGSRRFERTRTKPNGTFFFARSASVRGHRVRASVPAQRVASGMCAAGSSTFISG